MTLTEEQREAIRAVSDLPRAIGCTRCHNYIQKNYSNQFAVLRSMIDSSEHVTDHTKMIGFDLERARGLRDFLQDDCAEVGDIWGEMIAEIERLRGFETAARDLSNDLTRVAKERDELQEANTNFAFQASDQAQEIERLRAENAWLKSDREFQSEEQAARIEELEAELAEMHNCALEVAGFLAEKENLEAALVEERARGNHYGMSYEDAVGDGEFERWIIDGEKDLPKIYLDRVRVEAKRQLRAEGKIGPDAKPRVWQITEERKAALLRAYDIVSWIDRADSDNKLHITAILGMIKEAEAGQE